MNEEDALAAECSVAVRSLAERTSKVLVDELGCIPYVKTIYVGYEHDGEMVAALYPRPDSIEIALALPEDHESPLLVDATHLTWKTMPVAAVLSDAEEFGLLRPLLETAFERVAQGRHDVDRPNEFFIDKTDKPGSRPRRRS